MRRALPLLVLLACGGEAPPVEAPPEAKAPTAPTATKPAPAEPAPAGGFDVDDPDTCAPCHGAIVEEWKTSMHSRAHRDRDPIFAAMLRGHVQREGEAVTRRCANCHHPRQVDDVEGAVAKRGVTCATCHTAESVDLAHLGGEALAFGTDGVLHGPHDLAAGASPVHGTGPAPAHMKADSDDLCLTCHAREDNPQGVPVCSTGDEHAKVDGATCRSCHMPRVAGPSGAVSRRADHASHAFVGPRQLWEGADHDLLAGAVKLDAKLDGDTLTLTLANATGHAFPTGFPGRLAVVKAVGKDASGEVVWEDADTKLVRRYGDAEGKPAMPPVAAQVLGDSRLQPGETRTLSLSGVPAEAKTVEATVLYRLMPPPMADKTGLAAGPYAEAKPVATVTVER